MASMRQPVDGSPVSGRRAFHDDSTVNKPLWISGCAGRCGRAQLRLQSGPRSQPGRRKSSSHGSEVTAQTKRHSNCRSLQRPSGQYLQRTRAQYAAAWTTCHHGGGPTGACHTGRHHRPRRLSRRRALPAAPFQRSRPQRFSIIRKAGLVRPSVGSSQPPAPVGGVGDVVSLLPPAQSRRVQSCTTTVPEPPWTTLHFQARFERRPWSASIASRSPTVQCIVRVALSQVS